MTEETADNVSSAGGGKSERTPRPAASRKVKSPSNTDAPSPTDAAGAERAVRPTPPRRTGRQANAGGGQATAGPGPDLPLAAAARHLADRAAAAKARTVQSPNTPRGPVSSPLSGGPAPGDVAWPPAPENKSSTPAMVHRPQPALEASATAVQSEPRPATVSNYPPPSAVGPTPPPYPNRAEPAYSRWWKRACAAILDWVILSVPNGIILATVGSNRLQTDPVTGEVTTQITSRVLVAWLLTLIVTLAYHVILEGGPRGDTVCKIALNLTVRDESTLEPIGYGRALGRRLMAHLLWVLLIIPGILDLLAPLWNRRRQTWHDSIVGSVVVDSA